VLLKKVYMFGGKGGVGKSTLACALALWLSEKGKTLLEPLGVGSGLSKTELALRLRYEIKREFAPYVGVSWERHFGQTKEMVGERDLINFLVGLKTWF
jgi:uncharacterized protein involved in copper resistance